MGSRRKLLWASVLAAAVLLGWSVSAEGGFRRYLRLSNDLETLKEKNKKLAEDNARLLREVESMRGDAKALERAAREELGYVKPGEVVVTVGAQ
jgi:cell division protein FtsB